MLAERAVEMDRSGQWPAEQLRLCGEYGVFEWFLDPAWGGQGWSEEQVVRGYLALSAACLTTTFVITQRTGACRRIEGCHNAALKERLLPGLASGELFATVGISHLTTSRRHLAKPVLTAEAIPGGFRLERHVALGDGRRGGRCDRARRHARGRRRGDRSATLDCRADRFAGLVGRRSAAADRRVGELDRPGAFGSASKSPTNG